MKPVVVRSGGMPARILLGSAVFVLLGVLALAAGRTLLGIISIGFFGVPVLFVQARRWFGSPILIIDDQGYLDRSNLAAPGRVEWSQVRRVSIYSVRGQRMLGVELVDPEAVLARLPPQRRRLLGLNPGLGFATFTIPEITLPFTLEKLIDIMRERNPGLIVGEQEDRL